MSSFAISINVLNVTGLVAVTKGYDILGDIKAEGGIFRRDAIGDLVEETSWIVSCVDDADARQIAKTSRNGPGSVASKLTVSCSTSTRTTSNFSRTRDCSGSRSPLTARKF
ncbi:unnamed protein product [Ectocarpus sp. 8 AP-2014]